MNLLILTQKVVPEDAILGFFTAWLKGFSKRVDRLQVIALEAGPCGLPENTELISLRKGEGAGGAAMLFRFNRALLRLCRSRRPDAVLAHMVPKYALYALPVARLFRVPIDLWYTHKGVDKYLRMAHPFLRHVFTASEESFRLPSRKKIVTGHGIDLGLFKPPETERREGIITVGRITPSKDQRVIVEALALLRERGKKRAELRIVGEPLLEGDRRYLQELEEIIRHRDLGECVRFAGAVPHAGMAEVYGRAEIMVNASHTGSLDKVVLEAMAAGAIPLTCNESFLPLLGPLSDRLFFEKGNAESLALRMERLFDSGERERAEIAAALRKIVVRDHDLEKLLDRIVAAMASRSASLPSNGNQHRHR